MTWLFKIWHCLLDRRIQAPSALTSALTIADWQDAYEYEHLLRLAAERTIRDLIAQRKRKDRG